MVRAGSTFVSASVIGAFSAFVAVFQPSAGDGSLDIERGRRPGCHRRGWGRRRRAAPVVRAPQRRAADVVHD
jgi:hypothetical protein